VNFEIFYSVLVFALGFYGLRVLARTLLPRGTPPGETTQDWITYRMFGYRRRHLLWPAYRPTNYDFTFEQLRQLLLQGKLTQEEYKRACAKLTLRTGRTLDPEPDAVQYVEPKGHGFEVIMSPKTPLKISETGKAPGASGTPKDH
jgi:hypothetical protein